jgi:hypothetical protein
MLIVTSVVYNCEKFTLFNPSKCLLQKLVYMRYLNQVIIYVTMHTICLSLEHSFSMIVYVSYIEFTMIIMHDQCKLYIQCDRSIYPLTE